jgi:hypothetical protein
MLIVWKQGPLYANSQREQHERLQQQETLQINDYFQRKNGTVNGTVIITAYIGNATEIDIPELFETNDQGPGGHVIGIADSVFENKGLIRVTIPNSITFVGDNAFAFNQLNTVNIPDSVEHIGESAFAHNLLTTVEFGSGILAIGNKAFAYNTLTDLSLGSGVFFVGDGAFTGNDTLKTVNAPQTAQNLENAFDSWTDIKRY